MKKKMKTQYDELLASDTEHYRQLETENSRKLDELRTQLEVENERQYEAAKAKKWCRNCEAVAALHCCAITNYCSESCQLQHWPVHIKTCKRLQSNYLCRPADTAETSSVWMCIMNTEKRLCDYKFLFFAVFLQCTDYDR